MQDLRLKKHFPSSQTLLSQDNRKMMTRISLTRPTGNNVPAKEIPGLVFIMFSFYFNRTFVKNLRIAQKTAFKKKKKVEVMWRGFTEVVQPSGPAFTTPDLRRRLLIALRQILEINKMKNFPEQEQIVINKLYLLSYYIICNKIKKIFFNGRFISSCQMNFHRPTNPPCHLLLSFGKSKKRKLT